MKTKNEITTQQTRVEKDENLMILVVGPAGRGKTQLVKTLTVPTLYIDVDKGTLGIADSKVLMYSFYNLPWDSIRQFLSIITGPDLQLGDSDKPFSKKYCERAKQNIFRDYPKLEQWLPKVKCVFIDGITSLSEMSLKYGNLQNWNNKLAAHGTGLEEIKEIMSRLRALVDKDIILTAVLKPAANEIAAEILGVRNPIAHTIACVDEVFFYENKDNKRFFVCKETSEFNYPTPPKDRSDTLNTFEDADLGKIINKIKTTLYERKLAAIKIEEERKAAKQAKQADEADKQVEEEQVTEQTEEN